MEDEWGDEDYCLKAVKEDGTYIYNVKNQTEELCLEAIKENEYSIIFIKNPSIECWRLAVKINSELIDFIENDVLTEMIIREEFDTW